MANQPADDPDHPTESRSDSEPDPNDDLYAVREPEVKPATPSAGQSVFHPTATSGASGKRAPELGLDVAAGATVDEIWSHAGELWRPLGVATLTFAAGVAIWLSPHLMAVLVCIAGVALAGYWLAVTLDRPVRLTPEQAVREYLECLGHWLPNYRRMWLLLSSAGKVSLDFDSYLTFRSYWSHRLSRLRPPGSALRSLEFRVDDCECVYNDDRTAAALHCQVRAYVQGFESAPPLAVFDWKNSVTKGPDGMWYLDDGRLPETGTRAAPGTSGAQQSR